MRIDKYLQVNGYGNKEIIHTYIKTKKIKVNNEIVTDFHFQVNENDYIEIDESIKKYKDYYYLILNKPDGYVSARKDLESPTILSLIPDSFDKNKMNIVGRLDKDVTGLVLLTNNNKLYKYIIDPNNNIKKEYIVTFKGDYHLFKNDFSNGLVYSDGTKTKPFTLEFINDEQAIITLHEGKFHEIKKIFKEINLSLISIHRITIASISLSSLKEKEYRELTKEEINTLLSLLR